MKVQVEGYGYEFKSEYYGGPFDGLVDTVVSFCKHPPNFSIKRSQGDLSKKKKLGEKLLDEWKSSHLSEDVWVTVYKIEGRSEEYGESSIIPYHHVGTMKMKDFREKYN
jgi:hypothetical protein